MSPQEFAALGVWIRAEAKLIASEMVGHHPATVQTRAQRASEAKSAAERLLVGD